MSADLTILIAEPNAIIRMDMTEILHDGGFPVVLAGSTVTQAVGLVRTGSPDVVIIDSDFARDRAFDEASPALRISRMIEMVVSPPRSAVDGNTGRLYLTKPFTDGELLFLVHTAVRHHGRVVHQGPVRRRRPVMRETG